MPALCLLNAFTGPLEEGLFICPSHSTRQLQCLEWHFTPSVGHLQGIARHGVIGIQGTALHGRLKADSGVLVWASRLVFQWSLLELRLQLSEDVPEPFRTPQDSKVSKKGLKRIYINDTLWYIMVHLCCKLIDILWAAVARPFCCLTFLLLFSCSRKLVTCQAMGWVWEAHTTRLRGLVLWRCTPHTPLHHYDPLCKLHGASLWWMQASSLKDLRSILQTLASVFASTDAARGSFFKSASSPK